MSKALIITGTGYAQGATTLTAALAAYSSANGYQTAVCLPIETGVKQTEALGSDGLLHQWASHSNQAIDDICPYRLKSDLTPAMAAREDGVKIDFNQLLQGIRKTIESNDFTLIDCSGGLMQPLAGGMLIADLASFLQLPVLISCRPQRDSVNHIQTSLMAARHLGLNIAGYLLIGMPTTQSLFEEKLPHALATMTADELVGILPFVEGNDKEKVSQLSHEIKKMKTLSFLAPYLPK